jgi:hypothetical protein
MEARNHGNRSVIHSLKSHMCVTHNKGIIIIKQQAPARYLNDQHNVHVLIRGFLHSPFLLYY